MRAYNIFITCLVFFSLFLLTRSENSHDPDKCCFSYSNVRIPLKQVVGYYTTPFQCTIRGVILVTKAENEFCVDPLDKWVQRLMKLVDARNLKETMTEASSGDTAALSN